MSRGKIAISPEVADVLNRSTVSGNLLMLPEGQLERTLYAAVDKVLKALGGKWDRKCAAHVFKGPVADILAEALGDGHVVDQNKAMEQFFTPDDVVERLIACVEIGEGTRVLEPSAGSGQLVRAALALSGSVHAVEIDQSLADPMVNPFATGSLLVHRADFLQWQPGAGWEPFDVVLMNPPFSRGQDMAHVLRAFDFLRPGGVLAAIMSPHWVFATDRAANDFRVFLSRLGEEAYDWEELPEGAFRESGTSVRTGILTLRKPEQQPSSTRRPAVDAPDLTLSNPATLLLSQIRPGQNPRRYFDKATHAELVTSLRLRGMLQPMLVRPTDEANVFAIVAGERRYRAAKEAFDHPEAEVPVIIRTMSDQEALEAAIDENDVRDDASETEQADAAVRALAAYGGDRTEAAARLGWSVSKLDRRLALAGLSDAVKAALDERRIKIGHAELLAAVPTDKQDKALETILSAGFDVAKTREALMRMTQVLAAATFDKTECLTCPFNSGTQRALFETHVDDGHCTNAGCFQLKTEAVIPAPVYEKAPEPAATVAAAATSSAKKGATPAPTPAASAKPASAAPAAPKVTVTASSVADRVAKDREAVWRKAVGQALTSDLHLDESAQLGLRNFAISVVTLGEDFAHLAKLAADLKVDLRDIWQVDAEFLGRFGKDELKFIAKECGLVAHMGERKFAKLLESTVPGIVAGMIHAKDFDWAGRLPSAMTLDGQYSPPSETPAHAQAAA